MLTFSRFTDIGAHVDVRRHERAIGGCDSRVSMFRYGPDGRVENIIVSERTLRAVLADLLVNNFIVA